jgi:cell division inhibitor SulA/protein ImuA
MSSIDDLLRHPGLWRAREQAFAVAESSARPTGYAALDRCLPGGGWPRQGLIEILTDHYGIGELSLLMPALAALCCDAEDGSGNSGGWLTWVSPPYQPYAPALVAAGIDVRRVLVVRAAPPAEWAMEQALRSEACSAVLGWATSRDRQGLRRLQLASERSRCMAVLFRNLADGDEPSPAVLRIALAAGPGGLEARILKSRGGRPATVRLGWLDAAAQAAAH